MLLSLDELWTYVILELLVTWQLTYFLYEPLLTRVVVICGWNFCSRTAFCWMFFFFGSHSSTWPIITPTARESTRPLLASYTSENRQSMRFVCDQTRRESPNRPNRITQQSTPIEDHTSNSFFFFVSGTLKIPFQSWWKVFWGKMCMYIQCEDTILEAMKLN